MIKKNWAILKHQLNYLTLRERVVLFLMMTVIILVIWHELIYAYQMQSLKDNKRAVKAEEKQIRIFNQRSDTILTMANKTDTEVKRKQYLQLKQYINALDKKMQSYKLQAVSEKELADMIHAMLLNTKGVRLVEFKTNTDKENKQAKKVAVAEQVTMQKKHYRLLLEGNYFSILNYLKQLEQLKWQLYWYSFNYQVKKYPLAQVELHFYTLAAEGTNHG